MGTIDSTRSDLSKILLVACDQSYSPTGNPASGAGAPLAPLPDSGNGPTDPIEIRMPEAWTGLLNGWTVNERIVNSNTGFGATIFEKTNTDGKIDYIVAMQGTRGPNIQDWGGNLIYGWDKWGDPNSGIGATVIDKLVGLSVSPNAGNIHFTGQSLGGALAEYALYDFAIARNAAAAADPTNTIEAFDPSKVTLTTFNGLGGIEALQKERTGPEGFNNNVGLFTNVDTAHFWITNDIVHRLGGGHLNGAQNEYELKFYQTDTAGNILRRPDLSPIAGSFVNAHRIESGFYAGFYQASRGGFIGDPVINGFPRDFTEAVQNDVDILHVENMARAGTYLSWLTNKDGALATNAEAWSRTIAALTLGVATGPAEEVGALATALANNLYNSNVFLTTTQKRDWFAKTLETSLPIIARTPSAALVHVWAQLIALMAEPSTSPGTSIENPAEFETEYTDLVLGANLNGAALAIDPMQIANETKSILANASGKSKVTVVYVHGLVLDAINAVQGISGIAQSTIAEMVNDLAQVATNNVDSVQVATREVVRVAAQNLQRAFPGQEEALARNMAVFADAVNQAGKRASNFAADAVAFVSEAADSFGAGMINLAKSISNSYSELTSKFADTFGWAEPVTYAVLRNIGKALTGILNSISTPADAADLPSEFRPAFGAAVDVIESAGQAVILSSERPASNPFDAPDFDPEGAQVPSDQVQEGRIKRLTLSLPYEAGAGGQRIAVTLDGTAAANVKLLAGAEEIIAQDGVYTVVVEEGHRELELAVWGQIDVAENGTVAVSATLVDAAGQATHQTHIEANVEFVARTDRVFDGAPDIGGEESQTVIIQSGANPDGSGVYIDFLGGDDTVWGDLGEDRLLGGSGNDRLFGSFRVYAGLNDQDWLSGGPGDDQLIGGEGNDILEGDSGSDILLGDVGDDFLFGGSKADYATIFTIGGSDLEANTLQGGAGKDLLVGSAGSDALSGGNGDDLIFGGAGNDEIRGDTEFVPTHTFQIIGSTFPPEQPLAPGADVLYGNAGADLIYGEGGNDRLYGGDGADTLIGGEGSDELYGGAGNDILIADSGETGAGAQGNDFLDGGEGDDQLSGQGGSDILIGGAGNDMLDGGDGSDTYVFTRGDGADLVVEQGVGGVDVLIVRDYARADVTVQRLANGSVRLSGENGDSVTLSRAPGSAGSGVEFVQFADGTSLDVAAFTNQPLEPATLGGAGWETFSEGDDTIDTFGLPVDASSFVFVDAGAGNDTVFGGSNAIVYGNGGDDTLFNGDTLFGGDGNDFLSGGVFAYGGAGNDAIYGAGVAFGGTGDDTILEGNVLYGGAGNDYLEGGFGASRFAFDVEDSGQDIVTDSRGLSVEELAEWYYPSVGMPDWRSVLGNSDDGFVSIEEAIAQGLLPALPQIAADDFEALAPLYAAGVIELDTVEFAQSLTPDDVDLSLGEAMITSPVSGAPEAYATLDVSWAPGSVARIVIPHAEDPLGTGIEQFKFADGTILSLAEMLERESTGPAPLPTITGTEDDDFIIGTAASELILGMDGDDSIDAAEGDDRLEGGEGDDFLSGGPGNDTLEGGEGSDQLFGESGNDILDGGEDQDFAEGGDGDDVYLFGLGDGVDYVFDTAGADSIRFKDGVVPDDVGVTSDPYGTLYLVFGDSGDRLGLLDWLANEASRIETVEFPDGTVWDAAELEARIETLSATGFDDILTQTEDDDTVDGLEGNDEIYGLGGNDILDGGPGDDYLEGGAGNDIVRGGDGADGPSDWQGNNVLEGGPGDDGLYADGAPNFPDGSRNFVAGGSGNDSLSSYAAGNVIAFNAGDGVDTLFATAPLTLSIGSGITGQDLALSRDGQDLMLETGGGEGMRFASWYDVDAALRPQLTLQLIDSAVRTYDQTGLIDLFDEQLALNPALGSWAMSEALGDYQISTSTDHAVGGEIAYEYALSGDSEALSPATIQEVLGDPDFGLNAQAFASRTFIGTLGDDVLTGGEHGDTILGLEGNDTLQGGAGDDLLDGGPGNDTLDGGLGRDTLIGGSGDDTYVITDFDDSVLESFNEGIDTILSFDSIVLGQDVENLTLIEGTFAGGGEGNELDNVLIGNSVGNSLHGHGGNDTLDGRGGNDSLFGGTGDDIYLYGMGYGSDSFNEAGGFDVVRFGAGVLPDDFTITRDNVNLYLTLDGFNERVFIQNWFRDDPSSGSVDPFPGLESKIERFEFADGTVWDVAAVESRIITPPATEFDDQRTGTYGDDLLLGLGGNDALWGLSGNDVLEGGSGIDYLEGGLGHDILRGGDDADNLQEFMGNNFIDAGPGDDMVFVQGFDGGSSLVIGGLGNDWIDSFATDNVIAFNIGDSHDTVRVMNAMTLSLGAGIDAASLSLSQDGSELVLAIGEEDSIRLSHFGDIPEVWPQITLQLFGSVHIYDFSAVIADFQAALAADPSLTQFPLGDVLPAHETAFSETHAMGGALAHQYATSGTLGALSDVQIRQVLVDPQFGTTAQPIEPETTNQPPVVANPISDLTTTERQTFSFVVPEATFSDPDAGDTLAYTAALADGGALPSWLAFDALTRNFSGTPGEYDIGTTSIRVTVSDPSGAQATDEFNLSVALLGGVTLTGTSGQDTLVGGPGADTISAGAGADTLSGNAGWDVLNGGDGVDQMTGGTGNDTLYGGAGADTMFGDEGADSLYGELGADTLWGGVGNDLLDGGDGGDTLHGEAGDDLLYGDIGADNLYGGTGNDYLSGGLGGDQLFGEDGTDVLQGGDGADSLLGATENDLLQARLGGDTLDGDVGNDFLAAGGGADTIKPGAGQDVIAFNRGDGSDTVQATGGPEDTVSVGGGVRYQDLTLSKSNNDLVLDAGSGDRLTFKDWYAATPVRPVLNLQVIAEAMVDFNPASTDPLLNRKVQSFDFQGIYGAFEAARAENPALTSWALTNALLDFHLSGSDTEALGGDLAYQYGKNGALTGISLNAAQDIIGSPQFGAQAQALRPLSSLQEGLVKLS